MKMSATDHVGEAELLNVENLWLSKYRLQGSDRVGNGPVLPIKDEKNVLVTSALPNINNVPHLGDIGSILSADVFTRHCRSRGWNTLYISGVNEHGTETEKKALKENTTPQELCDRYFEIHKTFYEWLNISFDMFGRTTSPVHIEFVQEIFSRVHRNGYTTTSLIARFLCENCNRLSNDEIVKRTCLMCSFKDVLGHQSDGCDNEINATKGLIRRCNVCKKILVVYNSREVFLNLPKVETNLKNWMNKSSDGWSHNAQVICKSLMKDGLKKKCITRSSKWGISVLLEELESKVFCDWFATSLSYISFTREYSQKWRQWWRPKNGTKITYYQFMEEDNVPFYFMFPACLFATESKFIFADHIIAKKYLKYENGEFSKTRGIGIFGSSGLSSDVFRIYTILSESQETSFNWNNVVNTYNSKLFIHLGNICNYTLSTLRELFDSTIPEIQLEEDDLILLALVTRHYKQYITLLDNGKLKDGLLQILSIFCLCNEYITDQLSRLIIKQSNDNRNNNRARTVIGLCCNLVCLFAILLKPYMPETAIEIGKQMNIDLSAIVLNDFIPMFLGPGHKIGKGAPIFKCITNSLKNKWTLHFTGNLKNKKKQKVQTLKKIKLEKKILVVPVQDLTHIASIEQLEEAISEQANIIKILRRGNAEKNELNLYIKGLLEMEKKLCQMKGSSPNPMPKHR